MLLRLTIRRRSPGYAYANCPLCGDQRGKLCLNLTRNVWYSNCCGEHGGMLALYARVQRISNSDAYREICSDLQTGDFVPTYVTPQSKAATEKKAVLQSERAAAQTIHQTYSIFLSMLTLTQAHKKHLREVRCLTDEQIERFYFKSTPPPHLCRVITSRLIQSGCTVQGVPGFYMDDSGRWTVRFFQRTSGILVPYLSADGLIQGLQTRLDVPIKDKDDPPEKTGTKYLWLASADKPMGVSSGSPVHFIGNPCSRVVYVTEGALKADIAHALTGRTFVATGGAGCTSQLNDLFDFLYRNGTEEIIEAEDMDKFSNQGVGRGASKLYLLAREKGMNCRRLTWNPNYKGIDDWQIALHQKKIKTEEYDKVTFKEKYLSGECDLDYMEQCVEQWHKQPDGGVELHEYLGLTYEEYNAYLQNDPTVKFEELMEAQRRRQRYRVYQLKITEAKVIPFAFKGMDALVKAGYQQPPAIEYQLVYNGEICCPHDQDEQMVLQRIFHKCNGDFPSGYLGRSMSPSDVVELYGDNGRKYFYRDTNRFVSVSFSPALATPAKKSEESKPATPALPEIDAEQLLEKANESSSLIHFARIRIGCQDDGGHEADIYYFQAGGHRLDGTVSFSGRTFLEAYQSLLNAVNKKVRLFSCNIRKMLMTPKISGLEQHQICRSCGGTRLYTFEFRTDYAVPRIYSPVNKGTPEITQDDVPYRVGGTYCMDCHSFCDTDISYGMLKSLEESDNSDEDE